MYQIVIGLWLSNITLYNINVRISIISEYSIDNGYFNPAEEEIL